MITPILTHTEPKKNEDVGKSYAELERSLAERTAELATANKELAALVYSVSHDLRAPLRHIDGFSKMLVEHLGAASDETSRHYLQTIQTSTHNMACMLDDLLNLSRIVRKELSLQMTGMNALVEEALNDLETETQNRDIEWRIGRLPFINCDPVLMKQVFFQLLSNAVKFTRLRARTTIEVDQATVDGQSATFVRDNGIGFDMKYAGNLFGVFQHLHRKEEYPGAGVGLAAVQRIVRKHGGQVWAEAEPNTGAAFYFTLWNACDAVSPADGSTKRCAI